MTEVKQIYKCEVCGNIIEVIHPAGGTLVCCGKEMRLFKENASDGAQEKHVPVVEKTNDGYKVRVGSLAHPMEEKHYIEWIEIVADGISSRKFLKPGEKPEAEFSVKADSVLVREYCNLHGLWKNNLEG